MNNKKFLVCIILVSLFLLLTLTSFAAEEAEYKWKLACPWTREQIDQNLQLFCDLVKTYSDGKMEIEYYPNGVLGNHNEMFHAVQEGSIEMAECAAYVSLVPGGMLFWMPWSVENYDQLAQAFDNPNGILYKVGSKAFEEVGLHFIYDIFDGPYGLANNVRPIKTPDDLKNLKMRVSSSLGYVKALQNMGTGTGMTLHTVPYMDIYNALERGVIDGCWSLWPSLVDEKQSEVLKYVTALDWSWGVGNIVVNKEKWDELPLELQEALTRAGKVARVESYENGLRLDTAFIKTLVDDDGIEVYFPTLEEKTLFREKSNMSAIWEEICKPWLEKTYPGQNMTQKILDELTKIREAY